MKRILFCEDEDTIRDFVVINLERSGYSVAAASCGEDALKIFEEQRGDFDVAILDIMMPGIDGFEVCKTLRQKSDTIGIIMLTAKTQEMDKVRGLMLGADDYIAKPFSPSELVARVDAVYRRVSIANRSNPAPQLLKSGPFVLNTQSRTLTKNDTPIDLTQVEYQIMEYLLNNQNVALERTAILNQIWGENHFGDEKIVDVNIRRLRMKIEDEPSSPKHIITILGYGYKWNE